MLFLVNYTYIVQLYVYSLVCYKLEYTPASACKLINIRSSVASMAIAIPCIYMLFDAIQSLRKLYIYRYPFLIKCMQLL